ncbi:hypothetical protein P3W24_15160 [Luteibacter sp. PPL201]|uniref:Uncharacterized protein n=1 Tax=Luteibacter sahnii TaxID=3021977 RepID=A0ABT6BDS7_9GAMM|nr:hypothetical protein [Luteibacter sp. PPL193]MDY1548863.1 hypothetical protein [Luteibacter sp. PPL193]
MKPLIALALVVTAATAHAQAHRTDLPSCDLTAQREVAGTVGGDIKDPGQAHIAMRANVLEADIGTARKARRLTQAQADTLFRRVEAVRRATDGFVGTQGFLSAGERASYDRELDTIAGAICGS